MATATEDPAFPFLVIHKRRKDWGTGVFVGETDGKRRYVFENGGERTLAAGFFEMICRVDQPNPEQHAVYARLKGVLALRAHDPADAASTQGAPSFSDQIARLRETYPAGLSDPRWIAETRGEGATTRAPQHRQATIVDAQEKLSPEALESLTKGQHFGELWEQVLTVLRHTDLVPKAQLDSRPAHPEKLRELALALRALLYGNAAFAIRFDHYLDAFQAAFGRRPGWELATAPCALVHPTEHLCVDPKALKKQQRANSSSRPLPARPSSAGYASCLGLARRVANKLADQGELPRDLLEVRDFVAFTVK
jgi:hypothetical protein